ncbi:MAG: toxic anion resistance protein [Enterococcus sp.]|nr:toxic anion resistance protein [Enterococcus sp.]
MTLTPPDNSAIQLHAPEPVGEIAPEQANGLLPALTPQEAQEAKGLALSFSKEVSQMNTKSPEFAQKLQEIQTLAAGEMVKASEGASRLLQHSSSSMMGSKKGDGGSAQAKVAKTLAELRSTVDDLTPNADDLSPTKKILGFIPGGRKIEKYFQKYESAQTQLDNITKAMLHGKDELLKDNAALEVSKANLWDSMGSLNQYGRLAEEIDKAVAAEVNTLRSQGQVEKANALETDVLFPVRQRHQDILTQLAVAVQGYLAMDLVKKNNVELIAGVERARTTTISALETAMTVAGALSTQKLVLDQIEAVNATTNNVILRTSEMLKEQTGRIHEQAASATVKPEVLQKAFEDIYATMDAIDTFKVQANKSMEETIDTLGKTLTRSAEYVDRSRKQEGLTSGNSASTRSIMS